MDKIIEILQWAIPAGLGIWNLLLYHTYKRMNQAKAIKDTRDTWEEMANANNEALMRQDEEIRSMRETISRLEKMLFRAIGCRYYDVCPIRPELSVYKASIKRQNRTRFDLLERKTNRLPRDGPDIEGDLGGEPEQPP